MAGSSTILLDASTWDLVLDSAGNIALASAPYSLAQDAASAIKTFLGEVYFDTTIGVPYDQILKTPSISLMKYLFVQAALTVPDVVSAACFISSISDRIVSGQIQVTSAATGQVSAAPFTTIDPIGP